MSTKCASVPRAHVITLDPSEFPNLSRLRTGDELAGYGGSLFSEAARLNERHTCGTIR
jgi:hypothetical protein